MSIEAKPLLPERQGIFPVVLLMLVFSLVAGGGYVFLSARAISSTRIINQTSAPLYYVYISPADEHMWDGDLLDREVLLPNESYRLSDLRYQEIDLVAIDSLGREYILNGVDLQSTGEISIDNGSERRREGTLRELGWVAIRNVTSVPLQYLYMSPADADSWDDSEQLFKNDMLLLPNETEHVYIDTDEYGTVVFDILAEDSAGNQYIRWDVNIQLMNVIDLRIQDIR